MNDLTAGFEQPTNKEVIALRKTRLASTRGHIIIVEPGVPTRIPQALFLEAAKCGCVDYSPEMFNAFENAMAKAKETVETDDGSDPMQVADKHLKDAVRTVLLAAQDDPGLLTGQGVPRVPAVRAAFEELCARAQVNPQVNVNADLVQDYFLRVQEIAEGVELDMSREGGSTPDPRPMGANLADEEVGGDVEEMLARVDDVEVVNA